ncbi:MAG: tRNA (adenosine(37)-N6)-threonylcarbamoyltransferase complex ATPase subunit type 1 TsaE [Chloroflexi bacterium]|nr:tRNA (adenosine(37)-N6)-threonylcarbamoyltransferase complex ATPase subunit type 1 TsaE [Chloroflexota bacterium]
MPILDAHTVDFFSRSPGQTRRIGMRLGSEIKAGDVVCLQGNLGAGKTTFVQGLAQGWGSLDSVSSPTFILVNMYRRANGDQLFHLDTYRLESIPEAEELDLDTMLTEGALIIEWPERLGNLIPKDRLWINLDHIGDEQRQMRFHANGKRYDVLLDGIRQSFGAG